MTSLAAVPPIQFTSESPAQQHASEYIAAIQSERVAETNSIIAAWKAGHVFRAHDDSVAEISRVTGMGETYLHRRIRLAGAYTKAQLVAAIERSGCTHFTSFYSWSFHTGEHESNRAFKHRNVHVPQMHWQYFEALELDVSELLKEALTVIPPAELHAFIKKYVVD